MTGQRWRGPSIVAVAVLHTTFALVVASGVGFTPEMLASVGGSPPLTQMTPGFGSDQPPNLGALTFFWSIFFGLAMVVVGLLVRDVERRGERVPGAVGGLLLVMATLGAVLVPVSGFWLMIPVGLSLVRSAFATR